MDQNFVSILYDLSKKFTYVSCAKKTVESLTKKSIRSILNSYDLDSYCFSLDDNYKFSFFCKDIINYLLALSCSIHVANKYYEKPLIQLDKKDLTDKNYVPATYRLDGSPYNGLVLSLKKAKPDNDDDIDDDDDDDDIDDDDIDDDIDPMDKEYTIDYLQVAPCILFECTKPMKYLARSIYLNTAYCPYLYSPMLPTRVKFDGTVDRRYKSRSSNDFGEYKKESGKHAVTMRDIYESDDYIMLKLFESPILEDILSSGGPLPVEFFRRQGDMNYKNENIENILNSRHFFTKTYKDAITGFDADVDSDDRPLQLFNYFALETILNGSFIFEFCNIFSGNSTTKLTEKLSSIDNGYIDPLKEIFAHMNRIENPFIKKRLLKIIISTSDRLYKRWKDDISLWVKNICILCDEFAIFEQVIYEKFLSNINWDSIDSEDDLSEVCEAYCKLFEDCKIYFPDPPDSSDPPDFSDPPRRGVRFREILKNVIIINYKCHYPISDHRLFHTD